MKISIVLPGYYNFPIGGYHVLYTHANLLRARGHEVSILFPRKLWPGSSWKGRLKTRFWALSTRLRNRPLIPHFPLHDDVRVMLLSDLGGPALPKADVLIATGWATAELLRHAPADRGRKFYFVQDYEYWKTADSVTRERIESTYKAGFKILTISKVVDEMVRQCGGSPVAQVPNGIDFDVFGRDVPGADRRPLTLGFPIRTEPFKGAADAIAALTMLREIHGDRLEVTAFGSSEIAAPDWIRRLDRPDQTRLRAFYNDVAVFLVPSHFGGLGVARQRRRWLVARLSLQRIMVDRVTMPSPAKQRWSCRRRNRGCSLRRSIVCLRISRCGTCLPNAGTHSSSGFSGSARRIRSNAHCWLGWMKRPRKRSRPDQRRSG